MHRDDEVRSIVGYRDDELLVMPAYSRRHVGLFAGCLGNDGRDSIVLLNAEALGSHERITALAQGHRDLYRDKAQSATAATRQLANGWGNGMTEVVELPGRGTLMPIDLATLCERAALEAQA